MSECYWYYFDYLVLLWVRCFVVVSVILLCIYSGVVVIVVWFLLCWKCGVVKWLMVLVVGSIVVFVWGKCVCSVVV